MGGCQNYGHFLGPDFSSAPIIQGTQKGTLILTTTHMFGASWVMGCEGCSPIGNVTAGGWQRFVACRWGFMPPSGKARSINPIKPKVHRKGVYRLSVWLEWKEPGCLRRSVRIDYDVLMANPFLIRPVSCEVRPPSMFGPLAQLL